MTEEKSNQPFTNGRNNMSNHDVDDDEERPAECGIGRIKPKPLRICANVAVFTGTYSFSALLSSTLNTYVNGQVTTLERHFGFTSAQTGLIMAANDVGFLAVVLFVSYIAAKVHVPRALGFATVMFGISGIVCALPQFMFGAPSPAVLQQGNSSSMTSLAKKFAGQMCDGINDTSSDCSTDVIKIGVDDVAESQDPGNRARANAGAALAIIVMGMLMQGIAKTPRASFCTLYIDDNMEKTKTGFYFGIILTSGMLGPAAAYLLGGMFTRIYVTLEETDMHFRHPKWIGAWWLGYVTFGVAACIFAFPLFCFPRRIKRRKQEKKPATKAERALTFKTVSTAIKGFLSSQWRLVTNVVYICTVLSASILLFSVAAMQAFAPKYIENQFSFPAWRANISMAAMMLTTASLGTFIGGYISKRFKMGPLAALKFAVVMVTLCCVFTILTMVFTCDQPYLYNSPGPRASEETMLSGCHDDCACDDNDYFPVCGDDGRTFFSPCHAGCQQSVKDGGYVNCSCITNGTAMAGMCDYSCSTFIPFMIVLAISALFGTFTIIPNYIIYIRTVEERDKALAMGFSSFMASFLGWTLGPICIGKLIDDICIQWENGCLGSGACRLYDNNNFMWKLLGYTTLFRIVAFVFIVIALIAAKLSKKFDNKEPEHNVEVTVSLVNGEKGDNTSEEKTTTPV